MHICVLWDDLAQAELIKLYLAVDGTDVSVVGSHDEVLDLVTKNPTVDLLLFPTGMPSSDEAYALLEKVRSTAPDTAVVGACFQDEVYKLAKFLTHGMRAYVIRDEAGDYLFLLRSILDGVLSAVHAERERIVAAKLRQEVDSVRKLQQSIIPASLASPDGYEIVARYESSQIRVIGGLPVTMAGGDMYDAVTLADGRTVLIVGDASGHGMKACLSIMTMHTLIRMVNRGEFEDTAKFVSAINDQLCDQTIVNEDGGFITLIYAILDPNKNILQWTSAGHPMPVVQNLETGEVVCLDEHDAAGLPLGIMSDQPYESRVTEIPEGTRVMLYTDGLAEAFSLEDENDADSRHIEFGVDGLMNSLKASAKKPLDESLSEMFNASESFTDGMGRHDDTSVLLIERFAEVAAAV